jgi:hypothetical protein
MRRVLHTLKGAGCFSVLALALVPAALGRPLERFSFAASPAQAGQPLTLTFALGSKVEDEFDRFGIDLPSGTVWNGRDFPRCTFRAMTERLDRPGPICPARTRAGAGKATVVFPLDAGEQHVEHARITVVNGGTALHLIWKSRANLPDGSTLRRTILWKGRPDKQGPVTAWVPFSSPLGLPGQKLRIKRIHLKIAKSHGSQGMLEIDRCRNHRWRATGWMTFVDDEGSALEPASATDSVRCDP